MTEEEKRTSTPAATQNAVGKPDGELGALLDMEALLAPIPGEKPSGEFLQYEGAYDRIREARREDDPTLPRGIWERELKKANWREVVDICTDALKRRSKDLQISVWLLEALMHLHGFKGIASALELISGLCETYWDTIYPAIDEGNDSERRIFPFFWMNEKLTIGLKLIRITRPLSGDHEAYCFADWERANMMESKVQKSGAPFDKTAVTRSRFLGSVSFTPLNFYLELDQDILTSLAALEQLQTLLDEQCGHDAPSLRPFREQLQAIERLVNNFMLEKRSKEMPEDSSPVSAEQTGSASSSPETEGKRAFLSIRNRAEAYRMLNEAADYLHIHEPHSPTPYLVKRAVAWGSMPLEDLLKELVGDQGDLKQILQLLGIDHRAKE